METYLLGVDSGSTATKAVVFDTAGRTVAVGSRASNSGSRVRAMSNGTCEKPGMRPVAPFAMR